MADDFIGKIANQLTRSKTFAPETSVLEDFRAQPKFDTDVSAAGMQVPEIDVESLFNRNYQPTTEMQDRYRGMIDKYPIREAPGFSRRLAATLTGLSGGPEAAQGVLDAPFNRSVMDWKNQADITGSAADNEIQANRDRATYSLGEVSRQIQGQRANVDQQRANIQQQNALTAQGRLENEIVKNDRIYEMKIADLQRKVDETNQELRLAYDKLQYNQNNAGAMLEFRNAQLASVNARSEAQLAQRDLENQRLTAHRDALILESQERNRIANERLLQGLLPTSTQEEFQSDAKGNYTGRTRTTTRGELMPSHGGTVTMVGPDGKDYDVPSDKVKEAETSGMKRK